MQSALAIDPMETSGLLVPSPFFILIVVLALAAFVYWVMALAEALRIDDSTWQMARQSKVLWIVVMVFLGIIGAVLYARIARPSLRHIL